MIKKALVLVVAVIFCAAGFAMAADEAKKVAPAKTAVSAASGMTAGNAARPMAPKPEFSMISGKIEKINSSDPKNVSITVKNDKDGTSRTLTVMPWTNITKSAEISDLKTGEAVRVMARKAENKEIAMGIMFGKMPTPPPQRQLPPQAAAPAQAKAPAKK